VRGSNLAFLTTGLVKAGTFMRRSGTKVEATRGASIAQTSGLICAAFGCQANRRVPFFGQPAESGHYDRHRNQRLGSGPGDQGPQKLEQSDGSVPPAGDFADHP